MGKIVVLDDTMVNMIAAGEVIERPASVVKELIENSIDAGADRILVRIEDGGRKSISVIDNGTGIDPDDLPRAVMPHATSKLHTIEDLHRIRTMGFRGEALASIAAVAAVSIVSRPADSISASRLDIDCGSVESVRPCSGSVGTTIEVRDLFYKLPARRKFLRTANTEIGHITEQFTRIALAHSEIDLTLEHNGRTLYHLTGGQGLRQRIAELFSRPVADDLLEAAGCERGMTISAMIGTPAGARGAGNLQYVFLNRRFIRDKFISHALREAYRGIIEPSKYPVAFLFLEMPTEEFDVNVHPTKIEVRFQNSNLVHSQVLAVLREKLLGTNLDVPARLPTPRAELPSESTEPAGDLVRKERIARAMAEFFQSHKPSTQPRLQFPDAQPIHPSPSAAGSGIDRNFDRPTTGSSLVSEAAPGKTQTSPDSFPDLLTGRYLQIHNSYIVTQSQEGFVIIDQHALHERILYEQFCRRISEGPLPSQRLLIPETLDVSDTQLEAIRENADLLEQLGIELEPFGPRTLAIQSFPILASQLCAADFVRDLLDRLTDDALRVDRERLLHEILDMAACKAAIKAGQPLSPQEIEQLLADRDTVQRASRCPHGRPTTIRFTLGELEKQFKRTGF
ncbi:MAG: DNA mismatch repair endonuclease MutL [Phycisphaerae bacterium]|nr:DNA mismatch repair endonuclease MutL [Phycisphaerae bacterium]